MGGKPELAGQTVVVIGGTSGIGLETARRARAEGADVILTARDAERLRRVGLELGARTVAFDATDFERLAPSAPQLSGRSARSELFRGRAHESSKHTREVTWVLEARAQAGLENGAFGVSKGFLGALDPSRQHILMGSAADALSEELRKVVRAHPGDTRELRHAQVIRQVPADVIEDFPEATPGQSSFVAPPSRAPRAVATHEVHGQGSRQ